MSYQKLVEEMIQKIDKRRKSYGSVLVQGAIMKRDGKWRNIVIKILPLSLSDAYSPKKELDYGNFALVEDLVMLDELVEIIKKLPEKDATSVKLQNYDVQIEAGNLQDGYRYDSGDEYLRVGWYFEKYQHGSSSRNYPSDPLISPYLPLFPDSRIAIETFLGLDLSRYSDSYGVILCLPNYGARIEEINIGSREIRVKVQPKVEDLKNIVGKLYCQKGKETKQQDMEFSDETGTVAIGFVPDSFQFALASKVNGEVLDMRRFYSGWEMPRGVAFDIPEYEILEFIRHGETENMEFKETIGKPEKFAETAVAFANGKGGMLLLGVDDNANIVGLNPKDTPETITNILRSHCDPQIKYEISERQVEGKVVILLRIKEGNNKPYTLREKGVYVRANATDRIATRHELDEFYGERITGYRTY